MRSQSEPGQSSVRVLDFEIFMMVPQDMPVALKKCVFTCATLDRFDSWAKARAHAQIEWPFRAERMRGGSATSQPKQKDILKECQVPRF